MYLKSMDMFGFKSFADRTRIEFGPGITVVVGPNGCGKSNVVDSMKWVLGEKQAKNIRGEKMEDIIFTGTEQRKPVSLSEVSITLDNSNRILHLDSDAVTVTRRVFRDGESEYMINKSPVRLKDIDQLFMDTGIGKSAYSVMEQGKIDLILSSRAEDRRYIFEEAAGISKYKLQKKESLKKLQDTSDNLERINDIIKEIEREKDLKARQAEKTKYFMALKSELSDNDLKFSLLRYREQKRKKDKFEGDLDRLKKEREDLTARVSRISAENEKYEKEKNDIQLELFELDKNLHTFRIKLEDIDNKTEKNRRLINDQASYRESVQKNIWEREENLKNLEEERERSQHRAVEIRKKISDDREKLQNLGDTRKRKIESIRISRQKIEEHKKQIAAGEEKLEGLRKELDVVIRRLVDAIERRKAELTESEEQRQEVRGRINQALDEMDRVLKEAASLLEGDRPAEALALIRTLDTETLRSDVHRFESFEDGFRSILFDKTGVHAEKEALDGQIRTEIQQVDFCRSEINLLEEFIRNEQTALDDVNSMIARIEKDLSREETEREWTEKHINSLNAQIKDTEKQITNYRENMERADRMIEGYQREIKEWEDSLVEFNEKTEVLKKSIVNLTDKRNSIDSKITDRKNLSKKDAENLKRVIDRIGEQDKSIVELNFRIDSIEEYIWTEYEKKISDIEGLPVEESQYAEIQKAIADTKKKIHDLGPINNLAIEEYRDLKKRFEYYISQKKDIEKAREDILSVIEDINKTSVEMFLKTFQGIKKNFSEIFKQLFEGGDATVELVDVENILESGIDIMVRPPGKKLKNINLLSGGERALTAIALLFATYMEKPSPFCFLDEIDAPLDEQNIGRFVKMMKEFARNTQFIIVTHNKKTMSIGEAIYGVTMEEPGVSKIVSLKMEKVEKKEVTA